jgi:hypothetical protein
MSTGAKNAIDRGLLPPGAGPARVIVCERTGKWAVALRRTLAGVCETRSIPECWDMLARCPASMVVVELSRANLEPLLARMAIFERECPLSRIAVVADRGFRACEWLFREAGAVHFLTSPRELAPLARAIRRHLDQAPAPQQSLAEEIWARLPWGRGGGIQDKG